MIAASTAKHVAYVGTGGLMLPALLFASARARVAVTPLNYRLSVESLHELIARLPDPLVVVDEEYRDVAAGVGKRVMTSGEFVAAARTAEPMTEFPHPDDLAVVLFTSGTTSRPKAVELTHNNLTSYITGTVEFDSAGPDEPVQMASPRRCLDCHSPLPAGANVRRSFCSPACVSRAYRKRVRMLNQLERRRHVILTFGELTRAEEVGVVRGSLAIAGIQCPVCGTVVWQGVRRREDAVYCSNECRQAAYRLRKHDANP